MKKRKAIAKLSERLEKLEKQLKESSLTLRDPDNENRSVVIGISDSTFYQDILVTTTETTTDTEVTNITNQIL